MPKKKISLKQKLVGLVKSRKIAALVILIAAFSIVGAVILGQSHAATANAPKTVWYFTFPSSGGANLTQDMSVESLNSPTAEYFYANHFTLVNGDGGYFGLQNNGKRVADGSVGKVAIFSMFSTAIAGSPSNSCVVQQSGFDGIYTSGTSCRIAYNWTLGHRYRFNLNPATLGANKAWSATVTDLTAGGTTNIATIAVPGTWQGVTGIIINWTEWFNDNPANCADMPVTSVRFYPPGSSTAVYNGGPINKSSASTAPDLCQNFSFAPGGPENSSLMTLGGTAGATSKNPAPTSGKNPAPAPAPSK